LATEVPEAYAVNPRALSRQIDGEAVVLDVDAGEYYGLNTVGTRIWQLLTENRTLATILDCIVDEFDIAPGTADGDLHTFVEELVSHGLIVKVG
jgi:hypothetical protein